MGVFVCVGGGGGACGCVCVCGGGGGGVAVTASFGGVVNISNITNIGARGNYKTMNF